MLVSKISTFSGKTNTLDLNISAEDLLRYELGQGHVQDIFPHLTPGEREFLITGVTPQEWDEMFGEE